MLRIIMGFLVFTGLCALAIVATIMTLSIYESNSRENMAHMAIGQCFEGYAVVSFAHGGSWSFSQVFERDAKGELIPVRCGEIDSLGQFWRMRKN